MPLFFNMSRPAISTMHSILLGACFVVSFSQVLAQRAPSGTTTSSAPPSTHTINVGAAGLVFTPNTTTAAVGEIIEFRFYPQNHSVARADYKNPCIPYEDTGVGRVGFWSGFRPVSVVLSNPPIFQVTVNDTDPIFFYCSAPGACTDDGMVGVINPIATETLQVQEEYAKNYTLMFSPGEYFPTETASTTSAPPTSTIASSMASSSTDAASVATPTTTPLSPSKGGLSSGAIAGIAIAGAAVLTLAAALLYLCGRQRTMGEILQHRARRSSALPPYIPDQGHRSMASSATYPQKAANMEINPLGPHIYSSSQVGTYDRSAAETESYRSRSPPIDEGLDHMMGFDEALGIPGYDRNSPVMRRSVPESPRRSQLSPLSPMSDSSHHHFNESDVPAAFKPTKTAPQQGPHELDVQSGREYIPYTPVDPPGTISPIPR